MKKLVYFGIAITTISIGLHFKQHSDLRHELQSDVSGQSSQTSALAAGSGIQDSYADLQSPPKDALIEQTATEAINPEHTQSNDDVADHSKAYRGAVRSFEVLDSVQKRERRKVALEKVLAGESISPDDEVAMLQPWELAGHAQPGYQHNDVDDTKIDINGIDVDVAQPGVIVADTVMVYIPPSRSEMSSELKTIAGIKNIEPVFKNVQSIDRAGVRDPSGWQKIEVSAPASRIKAIVRALKSFDEVAEAEPVFERKLSLTGPLVSELDDPLMSDQWHLDAAKVKEAWAYLEENGKPAGGDHSIVVAVIDSGVDYDHPDLAANMWVNNQEIPGNGIDDDNNGFVDDIHGVSVVSESFSHSGDPDDDHGHGTHVAGIIASTGANGLGGVGVAYNSKIMAVKAAQYSGVLTTADIAEAIYYAVDNGADVINMSFGGYGRSQVEQDALAIAYSQAVLIAAAGNDGIHNQPCPIIGRAMYPASHPWVVGVMASTQAGGLAGFSNRDCISKNGVEYEISAPGTGIWSTLPDNSYSAWSGTSMSAPVASGIAALVRTQWPDKTTYSSRFVMGQLVATGVGAANALNSVSTVPQPDLAYEEHWVFDPSELSSINDDDGRVDAGETVELAVVIRNRWGKADNVVATLSTPSGASDADPYVVFQTASVNYGAVGSFNKDDNGITYDEGLLVTGVTNPFVFTVSEDTPNNHIIPFTLTMTANNGLEPEDANSYSFSSTFSLVVQRGRELPSIIDSDSAGSSGGNLDTDGIEDGIVTLDASALWIIDKPVLIDKDITVKVTPGAQIQFWSSRPDAAQTVWRPAHLRVEGTLDIQGAPTEPVRLFPSALFPTRLVEIRKGNSSAVIHMSYADVANPWLEGDGDTAWNTVSYNYFYRNYPSEYLIGNNVSATVPSELGEWYSAPLVPSIQSESGVAEGNRFYRLALERFSFCSYCMLHMNNHSGFNMSLFDSVAMEYSGAANGSVFLLNNQQFYNSSGNLSVQTGDFNWWKSSYAEDYFVGEPYVFEGKTYAIFYSHNPEIYDNRAAADYATAQAFSESMNGTLMTPNNWNELQEVGNWLSDLSEQPSSYWQERYSLCEPTGSEIDDGDDFCRSALGTGGYVIGLQGQPTGSYDWHGDDDGFGDEFLATQSNWDPVAWRLLQNETPTANDLDYNFRSTMLILDVARLSDEDISNDYIYPHIVSWRNSSTYWFTYARRFIVELPGEVSQTDLDAGLSAFKQNAGYSAFTNNAILNNWRDLNADKWTLITAPPGDNERRWDMFLDIGNNYWGGVSDEIIQMAITDFSDNFNLARIKYEPVLSEPPQSAYPFVVNAEIMDADGARPSGDRFGAQQSKWRITFNRDMDITKQPLVTFGPATPFTDFSVPGDWTDPRTWEGEFTFNAITGDGWQNVNILGAVAADNPRLVTGHDVERFQFELVTSGTEALTLQASGERGSVSLSWTQDDFELLHGYNLYRSMSEDGNYSRVNSATIDKSISAYTDVDVAPGLEHYYYFTVVSDGGESSPSNIAMATPEDTIAPEVEHSPESVVQLGDSVTLRVTATDNIAVTDVTVFIRNAASSDWQAREMLRTDTNRYSITLEPSAIGEQYLEYYIEVKDSVNSVLSGSADTPYKIFVSLPSDTDTDGDGVNNAEDAFPYDPNESSDLDGDGVGDNADPDDDGDGVQDTEDAFPEDGAEWVDTDGDGVGNNSDSDDDGDGVEDFADAFPLDDRGSSDSDADGLPDQWEIQYGLNPNDASDSDSDQDSDGFTALEEFVARTSPIEADQETQIIFYEMEPFVSGFTNKVSVFYRSSDDIAGLNGLGLRVHYDSDLMDVFTITNLLLVDLIAVTSEAMLDTADFDGDPSTDSYLTIAWAAQSGSSWPGVVPIKLFDLEIDFSDQVTSSDNVVIRFSASSTHPGYGFSGAPLKSSVNVNSLDIDGDGRADALSDGLLVLRSMFGLTDDPLIQNAFSVDAQFKTADEIKARIDGLGDLLDIDGDGGLDPLSDGLLVLRYLFGIRGTTLIDDVIRDGATRTSVQSIEEYLGKMAQQN